MMKKGIWIIIMLLLVNIVSAADFLRDFMYEGETKIYKTENGIYVLELTIVSDITKSAKFRLNKEFTDILKEDDNYQFKDGSEIAVNSVIPNEAADGLDEVNYYFFASNENPIPYTDTETLDTTKIDIEQCNFDGKCDDETSENCCYDCGCKLGFKCMNNECVKSEECSKNEDCKDSIACNKDECIDRNCMHTNIEGCDLNATCFEYGYSTNDSYCQNQGWKPRKGPGEECVNDYECLTNKCKENICYEKKNSGKVFAFILLILIIIGVVLINKKGLKFFKRKQKIKFKF